jgi:hypothetical protein
MLDYAANGTKHWSLERIQRDAELCSCEPIESRLCRLLELESTTDDDAHVFWQKVDENLKLGRVRLVFVSDSIPEELQKIVQFLNEQMNHAEVLAVEVKQFAGSGLQVLVPRVIGATPVARERKSGPRPRRERPWDCNSFFEDVGARGLPATQVQLLRSALDLCMRLADEWSEPLSWGQGVTVASFNLKKDGVGLFSAQSDGKMGMSTGFLLDHFSQGAAQELAALMDEEWGTDCKSDLSPDGRKYRFFEEAILTRDPDLVGLERWLRAAAGKLS